MTYEKSLLVVKWDGTDKYLIHIAHTCAQRASQPIFLLNHSKINILVSYKEINAKFH